MNYIYHGIPETMTGTQLIPLGKMQGSMTGIRDMQLEKYKGREKLLERKIALLDCLWNDVVQFLPVHPQQVFELQKELGLITNIPNYSYFQIDLTRLDSSLTAVFFKTAPGEQNTEVKWIRDTDFNSLQTIPPATIGYYQSLVGKDEQVFNYQFLPHIIHKGVVDVSNASVVSLYQ